MAKKKVAAKRTTTRPLDTTAELLTTTELIAQAKKRLSAETWDFICGGAETETTMLRNRHSLDGIAFLLRSNGEKCGPCPRTKVLPMSPD